MNDVFLGNCIISKIKLFYENSIVFYCLINTISCHFIISVSLINFLHSRGDFNRWPINGGISELTLAFKNFPSMINILENHY